MAELFVPFCPPRPPRPPRHGGLLRILFGKHSRNGVADWSQLAFEEFYVKRGLLGMRIHFPRHPEAIEHVLLGNAANYLKPGMVKRIFAPFIGNGLFTADGELWRIQRRLVAASFSPVAVQKMTALMVRAAERHMAGWPERGTIDIARIATETTMQVIADTLFSGDPRLTTPEAMRHIENGLIAVGTIRLTALLGFPELRIGPRAWRGARGRKFLRGTLETILRERGPRGGDDFMGGLIRGLHAMLPPEQAETLAMDNAATFYVAGHETTANALSWSIYLLANTPDIQQRAREEAQAALAAGDLATLPDRLPYLRQILDETLRLYPPAPRIEREAAADDVWPDGTRVSKGDSVSIWPWLVHRHTRLWDNPDAFDPDRFAPGREAERHRFQYLPFGAGPRVCVGARFAMVEALVILAHWLAARRFEAVPGFVPDPVATVTLRPQGGMMVRVVPH